MTEQATVHKLLEDAAAQAWAAEQTRAEESAAEYRRQFEIDAAKHGHAYAREILGQFADRGLWRPVGDPPDDEPWEWQAAAEVDGLRFLVCGRDGFPPYGRVHLYLLLRCPWSDRGTLIEHGQADRQIGVGDLAGLGRILAKPDEWAGFCPACTRLQATEQPAPIPTAAERLVEALETVIEDRIGQRLDGFLSTYLPDRI